MSERLSRRSFLTLNLEATVGFLGNIIIPQIEQERNFFRPPGSGPELEFLTSCTRCTKCAEACPEKIISMFPMQQGAKIANTPYIDPNVAPCTYCGLCIDSCPAGALSLNNMSLQKSIGTAEVHGLKCLAFKQVMCDYCVRSCPVQGAISMVDDKPSVNGQLCTGCGICVASCISDDKGIFVQLPEFEN